MINESINHYFRVALNHYLINMWYAQVDNETCFGTDRATRSPLEVIDWLCE